MSRHLRSIKTLSACVVASCAALMVGNSARADATFTVDPGASWLGYMNVSETPANGGGYLWGQSWGTADLCATFAGPRVALPPRAAADAGGEVFAGLVVCSGAAAGASARDSSRTEAVDPGALQPANARPRRSADARGAWEEECMLVSSRTGSFGRVRRRGPTGRESPRSGVGGRKPVRDAGGACTRSRRRASGVERARCAPLGPSPRRRVLAAGATRARGACP